MNRRVHGTGGFSLLELLVAFSLVLLIAVFVFDGIRFGNRVWVVAEENTNQQESVATLVLVKGWIENAYPYISNEGLVFSGEGDHLSFVTFPTQYSGAAGFIKFNLSYDLQNKNLNIVWEDISRQGKGTQTLLSGVENFEISYFGTSVEEEEQHWQATWQTRDKLPELIKLKISFSNKNNELSYEVVARPKVDTAAICLLNSGSGACPGGVL